MLKGIVAAVAAALVVLNTLLSKGSPMAASDWMTVVDAALGPILVYLVPNLAPTPPAVPPAPKAMELHLPSATHESAPGGVA